MRSLATSSGCSAMHIEVSASQSTLLLEQRRDHLRRGVPVGELDDRHVELGTEIVGGDAHRVLVAAMPVEQNDAAKAVADDRLADAAQHGEEGVGIERDGAAERHVMLGEAG